MRDTLAMLRVGGVRLKRCAQARLDLLGALLLISSVRLGRCAYANLDLFGDQVLEEGIAPWEILGPNPWPNTIAICAIMRDENPEDIRQWLRYHKWLGVDKFILADNGSINDPEPFIHDWIESGEVEYSSIAETAGQMRHYQACLDAHRLDYSWIAFIDLDEAIVVHDPTDGMTLKTLLRDYRFFPGLSVHWIMFGSSGHVARPHGGGTLQHYTKCGVDPFDAVKTIVNTYYVQHVLRQPHNFRYRAMGTSVNEKRYPLETYCHEPRRYKTEGECLDHMWNAWTGYAIAEPEKRGADRIAVHHYATRSRADFEVKMSRGGGTTVVPKGEEYWSALEESASRVHDKCSVGLELYGACCAENAREDAEIIAAAYRSTGITPPR